MNKVDLAINYAILILHDEKAPVVAESIIAIAAAAGITVPAYAAQIYVNALAKKSLDDILTVNVSAAAAPVAAAAAPVAAAKKEAPKKEEKKEESEDEDMGMGLFD